MTSGDDAVLQARICELLQPWQPWQRRLWDLGTVLALREAVEAADWASGQVLSPHAVSWLAKESLLPRLRTDAALRDGEIRRHLNDVCKRPIKAGARSQRSLMLLTDIVADGYLQRWRSVISDQPDVHTERASRCIASHMLDAGFHQEYLYKVIKSHLKDISSTIDLIDFFITLEEKGNEKFSGFIVLQGAIPDPHGAERSSLWMSRESVSDRLGREFPDIDNVRATGGFALEVTARDPYSAAHEMTEIFDRLKNRVRYRRNNQALSAYPKIFISGQDLPFEFLRGDPAVSINSLEKSGRLYQLPSVDEEGSRIDDALELAAPLTGSSPSTAVAGSWAALESLLFCDTDEADREEGRAVAADRAAAIVATAWPRAELAALSYKRDILAADPRLRQQLTATSGRSHERSQIVFHHLATGTPLDSVSDDNKAAVRRMKELIQNPYSGLSRVNGYLKSAFRRLYRQRNIVLHGGSTRSVALRASVRTVGPLAGAALDRIAYSFLVNEASPLHLAGRAQLSIKIVKDKESWKLYELLGE